MRHNVSGSKLKRNLGSRKALLRGIVTSVIEHERIVTTVPKAKAIRPLVEKMITLAKRDTLHTRRQAASFIQTPEALKKLFDKLGTRFGQRNGGYTRIVRLGQRKSDSASMAFIEWVDAAVVVEEKPAEEKKQKEPKPKQKETKREEPKAKEKEAPVTEESKRKRRWFSRKSSDEK